MLRLLAQSRRAMVAQMMRPEHAHVSCSVLNNAWTQEDAQAQRVIRIDAYRAAARVLRECAAEVGVCPVYGYREYKRNLYLASAATLELKAEALQ